MLCGLPLDVLLELISFLDVSDAISLISVSRKLRLLRSNNSFWHITIRLPQAPACPPYSDLTRDPEGLTRRTAHCQQKLLNTLHLRPVRVQKYLDCQAFGHGNSICPISGTDLFLTCDFNGMARCWNLLTGKVLSETYIGRKIFAKSSLPISRGRFFACLLVADTLFQFVATSVVVLNLEYDVDVDSSSYVNARLSILHQSPLDPAFPAMYPSCAINTHGVVGIVNMATSIDIIALNVFSGVRHVIKTDLTELDVDYVDIAFNEQDLFLTASNPRTTWMYQCPREYLPYDFTSNTIETQHLHLNLLSTSTPIFLDPNLYSYERCGFYVGTIPPRTSNAFAMTVYSATGRDRELFTECSFQDLSSGTGGRAISASQSGSERPIPAAHKCRLPGLVVACSGSETGAWGVFLCDVNVEEDPYSRSVRMGGYGHDFEIDVGVQRNEAHSSITSDTNNPPFSADASSKAEIFMVHYDSLTRTSSLHRPILPSSLPGFSGNYLDKITALEFDERLGLLFMILNSLEGTSLYGLEFVSRHSS